MAAVAAWGIVSGGVADAQTLTRLTVRQFTLSADTASPKLEEPFHLTVVVRVDQRVRSIANLDLPILAELELLGDERRATSDRGGTLYREVIGVVAHHAGDIRVAPATIDAIDPRDNRGKRYFSNDLVLHVAGGPAAPLASAGSALRTIVSVAVRIALILVGLAAAAFVFFAVLRARKRIAPAADALTEAPRSAVEPEPRDARDVLRDGLLTLRAEPTRSRAFVVRSVARSLVGAGERETLADVLRRPQAYDPRMRDVLLSLERAAFTYDADVHAAIVDAIASLEHATS